MNDARQQFPRALGRSFRDDGLKLAVKGVAVALMLVLSTSLAEAKNFWAAPNGTPTGTGTLNRPWDLKTAFFHPAAMKPGDTLYLRGGTYSHSDLYFRSRLKGAPGLPITVRPYRHERVIIDGGIEVLFDWAIFRDLEILNSRTNRTTRIGGSWPGDIRQTAGFNVLGANVKVVNNIIHDTAEGIEGWVNATDAEFYGNIIYNNGWMGPDRGHGHGGYMQNSVGKKSLVDNVIFNHFGIGLQLYGSSRTQLNSFHVEGNILFNNGNLGNNLTRNILLGGTAVAKDPIVKSNYTWYPLNSNHEGDNNIGYFDSGAGCENLILEDNYFVSGGRAMTLHQCSVMSFRNNTLVGPLRNFLASQFPNNTYFPTTRPSGVRTFVRPNRYESGRSHVVVFNWDGAAFATVNLAGTGLVSGDQWEVRDLQNPLGPTIATGVYSGTPISIPLTTTAIATPIGTLPFPTTHTPIHFGAFLVTKVSPPPALSITNLARTIENNYAVFTFNTSVPASVRLEYGTGISFAKRVEMLQPLNTSHRLTFGPLSPGTTYGWRVCANPASGRIFEDLA